MPRRARRIDPFKLNREIAYKGDLGKKRKDFCIEYIKKKKEVYKEIEAEQQRAVSEAGETITCHKGCGTCCVLFMQGTIQECEAAVYYLYENKEALSTFLKKYQVWRKKLKENNDIFKECARLWYDKSADGSPPEAIRAFEEATTRYQQQAISCPFLHKDSCLIYEVRPFLCSGTVATTQAQYCGPKSTQKPKMYRTQIPALFDKSFFYKEIEGYVFTFFPMTVYDILEGGYKTLAKMTGLEDLEKLALEQPEVKEAIERLTK